MKGLRVLLLLVLLPWTMVQAQRLCPDTLLSRQLHASALLHRPLSVDRSRQLETLTGSKRVVREVGLSSLRWHHEGFGRVYSLPEGFGMAFPRLTGQRAQGSPDDPDYAIYGRCQAIAELPSRDWTGYNCLVMDVRAESEGTDVVNLNLVIDDVQTHSLGAHLINLDNHTCRRVYFELGGLPRKAVRRLTFYADLKGRDATMGDTLRYEVTGLRLLQVERPDKEWGWEPQEGEVAYSMSGYLPHYQKTAILRLQDFPVDSFRLVNAHSGKVAYRGRIRPQHTGIGSFGIIDFTSFRSIGDYYLQIGPSYRTPAFRIGTDAFVNATWRLLNYVFCQRCGYAVPGIHGRCHTDLFSVFQGDTLSYGGGWHDAGDLSQQTLQTADVVMALLELAVRRQKDHPILSSRLREEAEWGLRFLMQTRFPKGYHASSMGLLHWTDSQKGTDDDIFSVRKQHNAFDNYLYAACEAYAVMALGARHGYADSLRKMALADFEFAQEKLKTDGIDDFSIPMEHTYATSASLFHAARSWSASILYRLTGKKRYAEVARSSARYMLACQEQCGNLPEINGFFYCDTTRRAIVHAIHQSRLELFARALTALCQNQRQAPEYGRWSTALRLYADYLKSMVPYTAPYDMAASGIYLHDEYKDSIGFSKLHLWAPAHADSLFRVQLSEGVKLDNRHYVKRFPAWFSIFNGNEAVILSLGKAAALCGQFLGDRQLMNIGLGQLYWTVGKNPFCQSLIYGEGHRYPSMDSFSSGELTGAIPVGIRSLGNTDLPYWPLVNNACYKEVWMTSAAKFMSLLSEYE